ncbi:MAG: helix-turn-helix transcriptional regulator [Burkholderiaceae bacterium]|jgi:predicted DNA-binding transcriptional regulator YafY
MSNTDRLYRIESLIKQRGQVTLESLMAELEVSRATLKRDLAYLRDRMGAPIEYDRFLGGYTLRQEGQDGRGDKHELPGLWFSERELYALLTAHQLLSDIDTDGVLSRHLQPLLARIHTLLDTEGLQAADVIKRVKILTPAKRPVPSQWFERVTEALIKRKRLEMVYLTRSRGQSGQRMVSPQRMVHYRATWYLDAWCHKAQGLRRFALDAIEDARVSDERAKDVSLKTVQSEMDAGYGIYAGAKPQWAVLMFEPQAAQWISREQWHPQQQGQWREDGRYELRLPYVQETEVVMDVLRHGPEVTVLSPPALAKRVREALNAAAALYR